MCEEDMWRRRRRRRRREKEPGGTDPKTRTPQNDVGKKDEVDGEVRRENGEGEAGEAGQGGNEEERQDEDAYEISVQDGTSCEVEDSKGSHKGGDGNGS